MKYVGSKARISRHILPIIQGAIDRNGIETYVEPFVGGGNLIDKVHCQNRIGYDNNEYLIGFWQALQTGWNPGTVPMSKDKDFYSDCPSRQRAGACDQSGRASA